MRTKNADAGSQADRVTTLHPAGKHGVRIERSKYEEMRRAILGILPRARAGVPLSAVTAALPGVVSRSVFPPDSGLTWYLIAVKQDLEARGMIEIVPGSRPQRLRRSSKRAER